MISSAAPFMARLFFVGIFVDNSVGMWEQVLYNI